MSELDLHFVVMIGSLRRGSYSRAIAESKRALTAAASARAG